MGTIVGVGVGVGYRRVRRPRLPVVDGNILWLRADMGITPNGSDVAGWADQSGAGNDAVQATPADQPAFSAAGGPNGRPAVVFDGANTESMDLTVTDASTDYTVFCVMDNTAPTVGTNMCLLDTAATNFAFQPQVTSKVNVLDGVNRAGEVAILGEQILTWRTDTGDTSIEYYRDGVRLAKNEDYTPRAFNGATALGQLLGGAQPLYAEVSELIIYNRKLTDAEVAQVHAYLAVRYDIVFSPLSVADCQAWWRADTGVTGDPVSSWANQGALGNNAAGGSGPAMSTLNSQLSMLYDDTDDSLVYSGAIADWGFLHDGTGGTCVVVTKPSATGALFDTVRVSAARIGAHISVTASTTLQYQVGNGGGTWLVDEGAVATGAGAWAAIVVTSRLETGAASEYDLRVNGVSKASGALTGAASGAAPTLIMTIGDLSGATATPLGGELPEMMAYSRYLSATETAALEAYVTTRYSL